MKQALLLCLAVLVLSSAALAAPDVYIGNVTTSSFDVCVRNATGEQVKGYDIYLQVVRQDGTGTLALTSAANPQPALFPTDPVAVSLADLGFLYSPDAVWYSGYWQDSAVTLTNTRLFTVNYDALTDPASGHFWVNFYSGATSDILDTPNAIPGTTFENQLITIPVPEPTSMLVLVCAAGLGLRRRR